MNCQECQESLLDYHYQELPRARHQQMAHHLVCCPNCGQNYRELHDDLQEMAQSLLVPAPGKLLPNILARPVPLRPPPWQIWLNNIFVQIKLDYAVAIALVVICTIAGIWHFTGIPSSAPAVGQNLIRPVVAPASSPVPSILIWSDYDASQPLEPAPNTI